MNIYQALDYAAREELLLTFYRDKRTVVIQDQARNLRFEERHYSMASPMSPGMAVVTAVKKHKKAVAERATAVAKKSEAP